MKVSIVYYSKTGNTAKMANTIIEGMISVSGIEARAFSIGDIDKDFVRESELLIVGTPTYNGYLAAKMKEWLENELSQLNVAGKIGGAFATAAFIHGGGDLAIQCILTHLLVDGMMVYSGGQSKGMPIIHLGPIAISSNLDEYAELFKIYGQRMAEQTLKIKSA